MTVYRQNTNIEKMYVYASELRNFWHFHNLKLLIPSIFFCWYFKYCLKNIFNFRCQITSVQCPFITNGMVRAIYIKDNIPTNTNIEQMYVCANERSERA